MEASMSIGSDIEQVPPLPSIQISRVNPVTHPISTTPLINSSPIVTNDEVAFTYMHERLPKILRPLYTGPLPKGILKRRHGDVNPIPDPPLDFEFPTERTRKIKSPRPIDSSEEETSPDTSSCDDETDGETIALRLDATPGGPAKRVKTEPRKNCANWQAPDPAQLKKFEAEYKRKKQESEYRWKELPDPSLRPNRSKSALSEPLALAMRNANATRNYTSLNFNSIKPSSSTTPLKNTVTPSPVNATAQTTPTPSPLNVGASPILLKGTLTPTPLKAKPTTSTTQPTPTPSHLNIDTSSSPQKRTVTATSLKAKPTSTTLQPIPTACPVKIVPSPSSLESTVTSAPLTTTTSKTLNPIFFTDPKALSSPSMNRDRKDSSPSTNSRSSSPHLAAEISGRDPFPIAREGIAYMNRSYDRRPGILVHSKKEPSKDDNSTHIRCNLCNKWFAKAGKNKIRYHVLDHCKVKAYQCRFCEYAHHELGKLKRHHKNVHKSNKEVLCLNTELINAAHEVCMKRCFPNFDTGKLSIGRNINYPTSLDVLYKCNVCKKRVYSSLAAYHVVDKHIDVSIYPCRDASGCKYQTIHKRELLIHKQACHNDSSMEIYATRLDFTDSTKFTLKSFFPEMIDLDSADCEPEFKREAEIWKPEFTKDRELRSLLAAQDGLTHTLDQSIKEPITCAACEKNGRVISINNVYDLVLHTKYHIGGGKQWKCPESGCFFTSHYMIEADKHCLNHHPNNVYEAINRWHELLPVMTSTYRICFPSISTQWPISTVTINHRAPIPPRHVAMVIKTADVE